LILLGVPPLGVYNRNTVGENGDFQPLHSENILQTVGHGYYYRKSHIVDFAVDFFAMSLDSRTAVVRLPLRRVVVFDESPRPRGSSRTNLHVLVLVHRPRTSSPRPRPRTSASPCLCPREVSPWQQHCLCVS